METYSYLMQDLQQNVVCLYILKIREFDIFLIQLENTLIYSTISNMSWIFYYKQGSLCIPVTESNSKKMQTFEVASVDAGSHSLTTQFFLCSFSLFYHSNSNMVLDLSIPQALGTVHENYYYRYLLAQFTYSIHVHYLLVLFTGTIHMYFLYLIGVVCVIL